MEPDKKTLSAWRLHSQQLIATQTVKPEQIVEWLGGVQAQDYTWAKWSIGLRAEACVDADVEGAIQDHKIVRTWMFRGSLHFIAEKDLSWLTALLAPGITQRNARRYKQLELDETTFVKSEVELRRALELNGALTRAEIKTYFKEAGISAEGQRMPYILQHAALTGLICLGLPRGHEPTYVLRSEWIDVQPTGKPEEGLKRLAERYFTSHGPATTKDFAWWSGLSMGQARLGVENAVGLSPIEVNEEPYWLSDDLGAAAGVERAHVLPPFDGYLLGYKNRVLALDTAHAKIINPGGGIPRLAAIVNGKVVGTWSRKVMKSEMLVTIQPFRQLNAMECDLLEEAGRRFGYFHSIPVKLNIDRIEGG